MTEMGMRVTVRGLAMAVAIGLAVEAASAQAAVTVRARDGEPVVEVSARRLAVFQPEDNEVWVVAEPDRQAVAIPAPARGALSAAWRVDQLQVSGGQGIRVTGAAPRRWHVQGRSGAWIVRLGQGQAPLAKGVSAVMLRDRVAATAPVVSAVAPDGKRYSVVLADGRVSHQPGVMAGLVGNRGVGDVAVAEASLSRIEPAAGEDEVAPDVPMARTDGLKGVGAPTADAEELAPLKTLVYRPGTQVSFTIPEGWQRRGEELVPVSSLKRGLEQAIAAGAVAEAEAVVSETVAQPHMLAVASATAAVSAGVPDGLHSPVVVPDTQPVTARVSQSEAMNPLVLAWPNVTVRTYLREAVKAEDAAMDVLRACPALAGQPAKVEEKPEVENAEAHEGEAHEGEALSALNEQGGEDAEAGKKEKESKDGSLPMDAPGKLALGWSMADFVACQQQGPAVAALRAQAALELAAGRAPEAMDLLGQLPVAKDGYAADAVGRFMQGVALVVRGYAADALPLLEGTRWPSAWQPQVDMWRAAAQENLGRHGAAVKTWPRKSGLLAHYPVALRVTLQRAIAEAQVAVADPRKSQEFIDALAQGFAEGGPGKDEHAMENQVPPWLVRLQGLVRIGGPAEREGLDMLAEAANQTRDTLVAAEAKYDFVQALRRRGELARPQTIGYMDELRLFWRGDELEGKILEQLGDLYMEEQDYRNALDSWQSLVKLQPENPDIPVITEKMTRALLTAFDPEKGAGYSALGFAGLYYDYKELLPADRNGDAVTERAADLMAEMGLQGRAIPLYEQLLKFSQIDPVDQARVALKLAAAYRQNRNAAAALQTLDKYGGSLANSVQKHAWKMEEARAMLDLKRFDAAVKSLVGIQGDEALALRADVAWRKHDWAALEQYLKPLVAKLDVDQDKLSPDVLRLAFGEAMTGGEKDADALMARFKNVLEKDAGSADLMAAMASEAGVSGTLPVAPSGDLGKVALTLRDMNQLADTAAKLRAREMNVREQREEYDNKMRYMELLPPPAI